MMCGPDLRSDRAPGNWRGTRGPAMVAFVVRGEHQQAHGGNCARRSLINSNRSRAVA
jgi:hypothetical protein